MQAYLAAHDAFVAWLDKLDTTPPPEEIERRLRALALTAAERGMTSTHWTFVIDGLVAYVNRRPLRDVLFASYIARGFDLCSRWRELQAEAGVSAPKPTAS
ncbi:MAG TPA: hypothetical protein VFL30_08780 [Rhodanobacteraceae bacterium]|nr:hypothetical protein [Rhodanobacteraceae bacterium]